MDLCLPYKTLGKKTLGRHSPRPEKRRATAVRVPPVVLGPCCVSPPCTPLPRLLRAVAYRFQQWTVGSKARLRDGQLEEERKRKRALVWMQCVRGPARRVRRCTSLAAPALQIALENIRPVAAAAFLWWHRARLCERTGEAADAEVRRRPFAESGRIATCGSAGIPARLPKMVRGISEAKVHDKERVVGRVGAGCFNKS